MKNWTIKLDGGCQFVECEIDVQADTKEEAKRKAVELAATPHVDWEIKEFSNPSGDDISVRSIEEI